MLKYAQALLASLTFCFWAGSALAVDVRAAVLRVDYPTLLPVSRHDLRAEDIGFAGAALADEDNGTTGRFMGHTYETVTASASPEDAAEALAADLETLEPAPTGVGIFEIEDGFPRLVPSSMASGIRRVSYQIVLAACADFRREPGWLDREVLGA